MPPYAVAGFTRPPAERASLERAAAAHADREAAIRADERRRIAAELRDLGGWAAVSAAYLEGTLDDLDALIARGRS